MATDTEVGARTLGDETAGSLLVQASPPNRRPSGNADVPCIRSPQKVKSVFEQFMQNLIPALGAWHV
jgi:hypothetical protein